MMMSLDTDVESDSEENVNNKTKQEDGEVFEEEKHLPAQPNSVGEHHLPEQPNKEENALLLTETTKIEEEEAQPKTSGGIVPQTKETTSLPGLSVRMDIPIIPMKVCLVSPFSITQLTL